MQADVQARRARTPGHAVDRGEVAVAAAGAAAGEPHRGAAGAQAVVEARGVGAGRQRPRRAAQPGVEGMGGDERRLQVGLRPRVVAGGGEEAQGETVGLGLGGDAVRRGAAARVADDDVGDLVGEHRRHLRLVPGEREHAAGDEHALAGQREGVRVGLVDDDEPPAAAGAGGRDQPPADAGDVGRQAGVGIDRARPHDGPRHDRGRLRRAAGAAARIAASSRASRLIGCAVSSLD